VQRSRRLSRFHDMTGPHVELDVEITAFMMPLSSGQVPGITHRPLSCIPTQMSVSGSACGVAPSAPSYDQCPHTPIPCCRLLYVHAPDTLSAPL